MANDVYAQALEGLQRFVSAKVAQRSLERALSAKGETPEVVSAEVMSRILLGPILSEFEAILPRAGLKRQLRSQAASLRKNFSQTVRLPQPEGAVEDLATRPEDSSARNAVAYEKEGREGAGGITKELASFVYQTNALSGVPESLDLIAADTSPPHDKPQIAQQSAAHSVQAISAVLPKTEVLAKVPSESVKGAPSPAVVPINKYPAGAPQSPLQRPLSQTQLEDAVLRLAQLEQVKFVAALRSNGAVVAQRGGGIDVSTLAELGLVGLKLLRRSGQLRAYYLAHTRGQLFLLPLAGDTLALVGTPELNVGAVFRTFTALKEE